jgi:hypothetical protein
MPEYTWNYKFKIGQPLADPFRFDTVPSQDSRDLADSMVSKLNIEFPENSQKIILFIVRRGTNRFLRDSFTERPLEDVVREHLSPKDRSRFVVTSFEAMSFEEQLSLTSRADVIVGAHGAALTNIIFAQKGTRVIEISLRSIFMCDPVCKGHLDKTFKDCECCRSDRPYYHKADYKSLSDVFGLKYIEVPTCRGGSYFTNENPLSIVDLYVDAGELCEVISGGVTPPHSAAAQQQTHHPACGSIRFAQTPGVPISLKRNILL